MGTKIQPHGRCSSSTPATIGPKRETEHEPRRPHRDVARAGAQVGDGVRDERERRRQHDPAAGAGDRLSEPEDVQAAAAVDRPGQRGDRRADHGERHADEVDAATAVDVAEHPGREDRRGHRDDVGVADPLQVRRRRAGRLADRRQRDADRGDRHVGDEHAEHRERDRQRDRRTVLPRLRHGVSPESPGGSGTHRGPRGATTGGRRRRSARGPSPGAMRPPMAVWATWTPRVGDLVVQHARVGDLAREGDPDARAQRVRVDRRAAGREQDRPAPGVAHRPDHRLGRRHGAEDAELDRAADVVDRRLEDRLHELRRGQRGVLEHLDLPQPLGERPDRRGRAHRCRGCRRPRPQR